MHLLVIPEGATKPKRLHWMGWRLLVYAAASRWQDQRKQPLLFRLAFASLVSEAFVLQSYQIKLFINWPQASCTTEKSWSLLSPIFPLPTNPNVLLLPLASCMHPLLLPHSLFSLGFIQQKNYLHSTSIAYQFMQFESSKDPATII